MYQIDGQDCYVSAKYRTVDLPGKPYDITVVVMHDTLEVRPMSTKEWKKLTKGQKP